MSIKRVSIFDIAHNIKSTGGGGGASGSGKDEKVKFSALSAVADYLNSHVDNLTIYADLAAEKLVVKTLDGLNTTVAELNFIQGLDKNIMDYIKECKKFKGVVTNDSDMLALSNPEPGDIVIVENSQSNNNSLTTFIYVNSTKGYVAIGATSINGSNVIGESWKTNVTAGNLVAGTQINSTDTYTQILKKMTLKHEPPVVTCSLNPNKTIYKKGNTCSSLVITGNVTKKSADVTKVELFVDGVVVLTETVGVTNGGTFTHTLTNITANTKIQWKATDSTNVVGQSTAIDVKFVNPVVKGYASATLNDDLIDKSTSYTWSGITCTADRCIIKFPSTFGTVKKVLDSNNFDVTGAFVHSTESLNGDTYNVYTSANAATLSNFKYVFSF